MYQPSHYSEQRLPLLHELIARNPLATVITHGTDGIEANPVPMLLDPNRGPHGTLIGHVARGNALARADGQAVLLLFHGPDAYISPNVYPSKREHGKMVPTWNYALVEVKGTLRCFDEPARLLAVLQRLTDHFEADQPSPWRIDDAPADFIDGMLGAITGIEIDIASLVGKFKLSQNRNPADRDGVYQAMLAANEPKARACAEWMERLAFAD